MVESNITAGEDDKFAVSLLAFWVKGTLKVDQQFLHINLPNTILWGLIPAGKNRKNIPIHGITDVEVSSSYKAGALSLGIIIALIGFGMFKDSAMAGLLLLLIGVIVFLSGIKNRLAFEKSGMRETIDVPFFEGSKIRQFGDKIQQEITQFANDTNVRMQADRQINATQLSSQAITQAIRSQNTAAPITNSVANTASSQPQAASGQTKFCSNCGNKVSADAKFCTHCGTKIN